MSISKGSDILDRGGVQTPYSPGKYSLVFPCALLSRTRANINELKHTVSSVPVHIHIKLHSSASAGRSVLQAVHSADARKRQLRGGPKKEATY